MIRTGAFLFALLLPCMPASGDAANTGKGGHEADTYRPAGTYRSIRGSTPVACATACEQDMQCMAWSLTPPTFRAGPKCELKSVQGQAVARTAFVSGAMDAPVRAETAAAAPHRTTEAREDMLQVPQPAARPQKPLSPIMLERAASQPEPATHPAEPDNADRPWPGLRRIDEPRIYTPPVTGTQPLPGRRVENVPSYSVQNLESMPQDFEDNAGLHGRLPSATTSAEQERDGTED